jgi:HK97 family phage major capsid protein
MDNHLKTISKTKDELRVANYMVLFGGQDLLGETFTEDTEFESSYTKTGTLYVDWEHGFDPEGDGPKRDDVLGIVDWKTAKKDKVGLWVERVLSRRAEFMEFIEVLIDEELIGTSTEATSGAKIADGFIELWPLKRDALTVIPAEPRMMKEYGDNVLQAIKSLADKMPNLKSLLPKDGVAVSEGEDEAEVEMKETKVKIKEKTMTEEIKKDAVLDESPLDGIVAAQGQEIAEQSESIDELTKMAKEILDRMQSEPANRDAGYYSDEGGSGDEEAKSFGDFLLAVKRNDTTRLGKVYKAMTEGSGTAGGYLVPEEFHAQLMEAAAMSTIIRPRATVINVGTDAGFVPALDQQTVPTAGVGQTAFAGGIVGGWAAEGSAGSSTDAKFKQIEYNIKKIAAYTSVSNELMADSSMSIDSLLSRLFGTAVGAIEEMSFLRGSGAGAPLGMLSAGCAIGITPDTDNIFGLADAVEMISRFKSVGGQPIWVGHISLLPDLAQHFPRGEGSTGSHVHISSASAFVQPREAIPGSLLGYPLFWSEHMPSANGDAIMLIDPKSYIIFDREPVKVAFSEHVAFTSDNGTFRVTKRLDGQPWMSGAITLAGPTALTVSPIVYHNDG